jgi:peptidoglycan/LPS O-acetylase OafA/YrhL
MLDRPPCDNAGSLKGRRNNFDFLRLVLAVLVIFSHSYPLGTGLETSEPFLGLTGGQTTGGTIAVNLFFIMSGYLITASFLHSSSILDYLGKRVRRIYPGFIAAMLLAALLVLPVAGGVLTGGGLRGKLLNFLGHTVRLAEPSYIGAFLKNPYPTEVNGSIWTIRFEFECYLGLMILGLCGLLSRRRLMAGIFFGVVLVGIGFSAAHLQIRGTYWSRLLPMYLAGVVAYLYRDEIRYTWRGGLACMAVLLVACFVPFAWAAVFPFAGTYLLFWIAFNPSVRAHHAAKFGDFSYGTYLYAFPVQQMIMEAWGKPLNPLFLFLVAVPLTLAVAVASWHFVERPFLKPRRLPK